MTRYSFNPYHKYGKAFSPTSLKENITTLNRRIQELSNSIQTAEQYLNKYPNNKPVLWRLQTMRKDYNAAVKECDKTEHNLVELLERMRESRG